MTVAVPPTTADNSLKSGRWRRVLFFVGVGLSILVGGAEGARRFLLPSKVRAGVADHLEEAYGGPVEVGAATVGWRSTTLHDVRFFEAGADAPEAPWALVESVQADVSLFDLLRGRAAPEHLVVDGGTIALRFDGRGRLATSLPVRKGEARPLPAVHLRDGRLVLHQEGRPADMVVNGVDADLSGDGPLVTLEGTVADPLWSGWTVNGTLDRETRALSATLETDQIHVRQALLDRLPFVPPGVWRQVQVEGDTPVALTLRTDPSPAVHYQVAMALKAAQVRVAAIDLSVDEARGRVVVANGVVRLEDVWGTTANGEIRTSGTIDFLQPPGRLDLTVVAKGLDVASLPRSWSLPKGAQGKLSTKLSFRMPLKSNPADAKHEGVRPMK